MNALAQKENARTLAAALGIAEDQAAELLDVNVAVTYDAEDNGAANCATHVAALLKRTIRSVSINSPKNDLPIAVEIVIGGAAPKFVGRHVFVCILDEAVAVSRQPISAPWGKCHPVGILIGACYAVAAGLKVALGDLLPFRVPDFIHLNLSELLGPDLPLLYEPVPFDEAYLAGAGAVGNGFIYGLGQFDVTGKLHVADDDKVGSGNIQRCHFFDEEHLELSKADVLCEAIPVVLPNIVAVPHRVRLQDVPTKYSGPWLKRLIVGVDSPRARRSLQTEIPGEVFDASTTGITEIVFHFHRQPTAGACLACVYPHTPQEDAHEAHVSDALGVSVADVRQSRISGSAAELICRRYPHLIPDQLIGTAYDTLFKQLCSTAKLRTAEDRQVLAPFAFVSVLAGTFLAMEFVRRVRRGHENLFNEWRISPWSNPVLRRRRTLGRNSLCEFCSDSTLGALAHEIWSPATPTEAASIV
jgi:hypothetical protein